MSHSDSTNSVEPVSAQADQTQYHTISFSNSDERVPEPAGGSLRSLLQDKDSRSDALVFVNQSSRADEAARAHRLEDTSSTSSVRTQKRSTKRQKEKITVWLERPIAAELEAAGRGKPAVCLGFWGGSAGQGSFPWSAGATTGAP